MRYISLFSGIGALDLAVRSVLGAETEAYVEIDGFCQKVLRARMKDGYLEKAEIFGDVRKFKWEKTDMVVGGFPCQPFSLAGERKGESDDRNMWPDTLRVIRMARPEYVFLENVPGLLSGDGEGRQPYVYTILANLAEEGFDAEWEIVGADDAGAPHRRKRWFCFAYRKLDDSEYTRLDGLQVAGSFGQGKSDGKTEQGESEQSKGSGRCESGIDKLADSDSSGYIHRESEIDSDKRRIDALSDTSHSCDEISERSFNYPPGPSDSSGWEYLLSIMPEVEPAFCRISDDGEKLHRMDRLKALGNAVAWQAGAIALRLCIERSGVLNGSAAAQSK